MFSESCQCSFHLVPPHSALDRTVPRGRARIPADGIIVNVDRIYALHQIFRARRTPISTQALQGRLECSRSTLQRAFDHLRNLGAPLSNMPGRGYFYDRTADAFELPGVWLRADELEALLVMDRLLERLEPGLLRPRIGPIRGRLHQYLDSAVPGLQRFPAHRIRILTAHARRLAPERLARVVSAVIERRGLLFTYAARTTGSVTQRTVSPQRLVHYRDQWYMDGWDEDKHALRTFSVDRMTGVKVLQVAATECDERELDAALTRGYGIFAGAVVARARLVFTPERARWIADESWHPEQHGQFRSDGTYELVVPYSDPRELLGEILRHGPEVRVLEPDALVRLVRERLVRAVDRYGGESEPASSAT